MSPYRFCVERGGWRESTAIDELIQRGEIAENGQTRQIAGIADLVALHRRDARSGADQPAVIMPLLVFRNASKTC
jgi:hypothetical protein